MTKITRTGDEWSAIVNMLTIDEEDAIEMGDAALAEDTRLLYTKIEAQLPCAIPSSFVYEGKTIEYNEGYWDRSDESFEIELDEDDIKRVEFVEGFDGDDE